MGNARYSASAWKGYVDLRKTKTRSDIFKAREIVPDLDPRNFHIRESRDSEQNPNSTAIIIANDITGSMGILAEQMVRKGIGVTFEEIIRHSADPNIKMVTDPHLLVMGIGDVDSDTAPIQATQFEASETSLAEQTEQIYLEGNGGSNDHESYDLAWYFASHRVSADCWDIRGKKGYLFTAGDEKTPIGLTSEKLKKFLGDEQQYLSPSQLLEMALTQWNVYHIVVAEGFFARRNLDRVMNAWQGFLGENTLLLHDHTKLSEVIVSAILLNEGNSFTDVVESWSGDTSLVVKAALENVVPATSGGIITL